MAGAKHDKGDVTLLNIFDIRFDTKYISSNLNILLKKNLSFILKYSTICMCNSFKTCSPSIHIRYSKHTKVVHIHVTMFRVLIYNVYLRVSDDTTEP